MIKNYSNQYLKREISLRPLRKTLLSLRLKKNFTAKKAKQAQRTQRKSLCFPVLYPTPDSHKYIYFKQAKNHRGKFFLYKSLFTFLRFYVFALIFIFPASAQKIAILTPDKTEPSREFALEIGKKLSADYKILDASLSETAFRSAVFENENPFNLSVEEAKNMGRAIGCNYFLLVKHETLRRASLKKNDYYESYGVIFAVSSRTGKLVFWKLNSFESERPSEAEKKLYDSIVSFSKELSGALQAAKISEIAPNDNRNIEEMPPDGSPETKNFRPPLPYRRISPVYTSTANLYGIKATVDILVDIDETGKVLRTEIERWAGYDLDESVAEAVRKMNWRPAERDGKRLPMRILLRYNFKNIESDD